MKEDIVAKIKNLSIVQIISHYIPLKKINQKQYKGCCPFHKERTPSFFVDIEGFYKCFGCNKGGDVINFVQEVESFEFKDAVDKICTIAGIENTKDKFFPPSNKQKDLISINNQLAEFFHKALFLKKNKEILDYLLIIRKLNLETIKKFKIGYCEDNLGEIKSSLSVSEEDLISLSVLKKVEFNGKAQHRLFFAKRITIPIFNKKNDVISFGGRVYDEASYAFKPMKYLNGSNNDLFQKSAMLFNINNAYTKPSESPTQQKTPLIIVEGYMDAIVLWQNKIKSLASLGTSLTGDQIKMIFSIDKEPYFCYDSDNAGKAATFNICKKIAELLEPGLSPKFINLQNAKDIDEFLNKFDKASFDNLLKGAINYIDYVFEYFAINCDISNPNEKSILEKQLEDFLKEIKNKIIQKNYTFYLKNKIFQMSVKKNDNRKKITTSELNYKSSNLLFTKLASFLLQNKKFLENENLFQTLQEENQEQAIISDIINGNLSEQIKEAIKNKYQFGEDKDYAFNSILSAIKLEKIRHNTGQKTNKENGESLDSKNQMAQKIARKQILIQKMQEGQGGEEN